MTILYEQVHVNMLESGDMILIGGDSLQQEYKSSEELPGEKRIRINTDARRNHILPADAYVLREVESIIFEHRGMMNHEGDTRYCDCYSVRLRGDKKEVKWGLPAYMLKDNDRIAWKNDEGVRVEGDVWDIEYLAASKEISISVEGGGVPDGTMITVDAGEMILIMIDNIEQRDVRRYCLSEMEI